MTSETEDVSDQHPYADILLENNYRERIAELEEALAYEREANEGLRDEQWELKQTVTNVTDARAWVIIELMHKNGKPGDVLEAPRIASILRKVDDPILRLPDKPNVRRQVIDVIYRMEILDPRFRKEKIKHAKNTWRIIQDY